MVMMVCITKGAIYNRESQVQFFGSSIPHTPLSDDKNVGINPPRRKTSKAYQTKYQKAMSDRDSIDKNSCNY